MDVAAYDLLGGAVRALGTEVQRLVRSVTDSDPALPLDGRVVFITGAARGLGAELARQCHARGASVSLVGRRLAPLQELAETLGPRAAAFEADVTDFDAL